MLSRGQAINILIANAVCTSDMECSEYCPFYKGKSPYGGVKCFTWSAEMMTEAVETVRSKEMPTLESVDGLDDQALNVLRAFVDCNMNVASAADKCFVHRNTAVYHLKKVKRITGLDPHNLHDLMELVDAMGLRRTEDVE